MILALFLVAWCVISFLIASALLGFLLEFLIGRYR